MPVIPQTGRKVSQDITNRDLQGSEDLAKLSAPIIANDSNLQRIISQIYDELNKLNAAVNQNKAANRDHTGKEGDIRVVDHPEKQGVSVLQGYSKNGWMQFGESGTVVHQGKLPEEVYDESQRPLLVTPDFDSGWKYLVHTDAKVNEDPPMQILHNLGTLPKIVIIYFAPNQGSGSIGDSVNEDDITWFTEIDTDMGNAYAHGAGTYISRTDVRIHAGITRTIVSSDFGLTAGGHAAVYNDGSIRVLIWK